jgi:hypothetical protein
MQEPAMRVSANPDLGAGPVGKKLFRRLNVEMITSVSRSKNDSVAQGKLAALSDVDQRNANNAHRTFKDNIPSHGKP